MNRGNSIHIYMDIYRYIYNHPSIYLPIHNIIIRVVQSVYCFIAGRSGGKAMANRLVGEVGIPSFLVVLVLVLMVVCRGWCCGRVCVDV